MSFSIQPGEVFALVGESGCGKTATALSIMGLIPRRMGRVVKGEVFFGDEELLTIRPERLRQIRGDRIAMVFQEPTLDPTSRIGDQIAEVIRAHRDLSRRQAGEQAVELLEVVGIPGAAQRARDYPHQFSGGMRERAMIAMALSLRPDLLIADEPTTALDVTIQAQILELLIDLRLQFGMAVLLITHDLGLVAGFAQRVMVMYAGRKAEEADVRSLYRRPRHPYTYGLLACTTRLDRSRPERLPQILGSPPSLIDPAPTCHFAPRCPCAQDVCRQLLPQLLEVDPGHVAACHFAQDDRWTPC
ncbi:MAG: ABC transporter ATP-binding protein [Pseudonocardiaceae bacterium]